MSALWLLFSTLSTSTSATGPCGSCGPDVLRFITSLYKTQMISLCACKARGLWRPLSWDVDLLDGPLSNYRRLGGKIRRWGPGLKTAVCLWCEFIQLFNSWNWDLNSEGMRMHSREKHGGGLQGLSCSFSQHHRQEVIQLQFTALLSCNVKGDWSPRMRPRLVRSDRWPLCCVSRQKILMHLSRRLLAYRVSCRHTDFDKHAGSHANTD